MTMVTGVSYAYFAAESDTVQYRVYTVPVEDYTPGIGEGFAALVSTREVQVSDAPSARGVENIQRGPDGKPVHRWTGCGYGHSWDDALETSLTPTPSGRCPWEHLHTGDETDSGEKTWTFFGHWEGDRIAVEYARPGIHNDDRIDLGYWPEGLWADSSSGATIEEAQANAVAEYEEEVRA